MKLIHKLVLGYLVISSFSVLTTYIAIRSFRDVEDTVDNLTKDVVPEIQILKDMKSAGLQIVSSTYEIISLRSESAPDVEEQVAEAVMDKGFLSGTCAVKIEGLGFMGLCADDHIRA